MAEKGKEGEAGEDGPLYSLSTAGYLDWIERGVVILFAVVNCFQGSGGFDGISCLPFLSASALVIAFVRHN